MEIETARKVIGRFFEKKEKNVRKQDTTKYFLVGKGLEEVTEEELRGNSFFSRDILEGIEKRLLCGNHEYLIDQGFFNPLDVSLSGLSRNFSVLLKAREKVKSEEYLSFFSTFSSIKTTQSRAANTEGLYDLFLALLLSGLRENILLIYGQSGKPPLTKDELKKEYLVQSQIYFSIARYYQINYPENEKLYYCFFYFSESASKDYIRSLKEHLRAGKTSTSYKERARSEIDILWEQNKFANQIRLQERKITEVSFYRNLEQFYSMVVSLNVSEFKWLTSNMHKELEEYKPKARD